MFNSPFRIFSSSAFTVIFCRFRVTFTSGFSAHTMHFGLGEFNWHGTRIFFRGFGFRAYFFCTKNKNYLVCTLCIKF